MSDTDGGPRQPDELAAALLRQVDALELSELRALRSYIDQRIDTAMTPIDAAARADAPGEVVEIERHGDHALVRTHPPAAEADGMDTAITSLYHVRRTRQLDGTDALEWTYLGDAANTTTTRCETCGRPVAEETAECPHCDSGVDRSGTEG